VTRPKTRTAVLERAAVQDLKKQFGTRPNAFAQLMPGGTPLTYTVFNRAASGLPVTPADLAALKATLAAWKRTHLK